MFVAFRPVSRRATPPASPLALFDSLPRMAGAVPELWRQQADVLRAYGVEHVDDADLAVELPTGTGKTLVGLLIGGWRQAARGEQVVYACPTSQLARQVHDVAVREGIPAVLLVDGWRAWDPADVARYDKAQALAVTNYSTVFNSSPKIGSPGAVIFDDAHAGEQWVAEAWSVNLKASEYWEVWAGVMEAIRPALDGMFYQRVTQEQPDPAIRAVVRLVVPARRAGMAERIDAALAQLPGGSPAFFHHAMIRSGLESCLVYVGWRKVLIRPFVPPTFENAPFDGATQRLYLSATLGHGGELERAFGRPKITRLPLPADSAHPRNGRRFFVFTDLLTGADQEVARRVVEAAGKALVLAPSDWKVQAAASDLTPVGWTRLDKAHVQKSLQPFITADRAILALANRYDGLDLPGNACRAVVLDGLPDAAHLQERFLTDRARVGTALEERVRTRVVQGAGRATRGPSDHAVVVVRGSDLTRFLTGRDRVRAMEPDMQAEIEFGSENSTGATADAVLANVRMFLDQGEEWRTQAEPLLAEARTELERVDPVGTDRLADSVPHELRAWACAWRSDWPGAMAGANAVARSLQGQDRLRHYRAFWLYLASVWARRSNDPSAARTAAGLLELAVKAAPGSWISETEPDDDAGAVVAHSVDTPAVRQITGQVASTGIRGKIEKVVADTRSGLAATAPGQFEPALTGLGKLLGAEAYKPAGQARSDAAWCFGEALWITFEAKSDQNPDGPVAVRDVREANTQLRTLGRDRGHEPPPDSFSVIVTARTSVDPDAALIAEPHLHLTDPPTVISLLDDAVAAWEELLSKAPGHDPGQDLERLARRIFGTHRVLPSQIRERLTAISLSA